MITKSKSKLLDDICPECYKYDDISRILEVSNRFGIVRFCSEKCGWKEKIKRFESFGEILKKKYPVNKEMREKKLKEMRESRKKVKFNGIKISLC